MLVSSIPLRFPMPFAASAGGSYIRVIPSASQIGITPGAASLTDGFPPLNFTPVSGGGVPPFGQDFNGILNWTSAWNQWQAAGSPVVYDATFSTAIGGYPKGALLNAVTGVGFWSSTVDNNTTDPDAGGANWQQITFGQIYAGNPNGFVAGTAVNANGVTQSLLWDTSNLILWVCTTTGNAAGAVWTQVTGSVGSVAVATANGFAGTSSGGGAPVLTLTTSVTGLLKGSGGAIVAASAGTDFVVPSQFTGSNQSLTTPGWQAMPGGCILQWGITNPVPTGSGGLSTSFPLAFPTACRTVVASFTNGAAPSSGADMAHNITAISTSAFTITQQSGAASQYQWFAVGH